MGLRQPHGVRLGLKRRKGDEGSAPSGHGKEKVAATPKTTDDSQHANEAPDDDQGGAAGGALAAATEALRRLRPDGPNEELSFYQPEREWTALREYAQAQGLILPADFPGPLREGGREHDVRFDEATGRWWKYTKRTAAGYTVDWTGRLEDAPQLLPALPLDYLERLMAQNAVFADDIRLEGLWPDGSRDWRIITSQPDVPGEPASAAEIVLGMEASGWETLPFRGVGYDDSLAFVKLTPEGLVWLFGMHTLETWCEPSRASSFQSTSSSPITRESIEWMLGGARLVGSGSAQRACLCTGGATSTGAS